MGEDKKSKVIAPKKNFNKSSKGKPTVAKEENMGVFFKHDCCTMQLFHGLSATNAALRVNALKKMYNDWDGHFLIVKSKFRDKKAKKD